MSSSPCIVPSQQSMDSCIKEIYENLGAALLGAAPDVNKEGVAIVADGVQSAGGTDVPGIPAEGAKDALHNAGTLPPCHSCSHTV